MLEASMDTFESIDTIIDTWLVRDIDTIRDMYSLLSFSKQMSLEFTWFKICIGISRWLKQFDISKSYFFFVQKQVLFLYVENQTPIQINLIKNQKQRKQGLSFMLNIRHNTPLIIKYKLEPYNVLKATSFNQNQTLIWMLHICIKLLTQ